MRSTAWLVAALPVVLGQTVLSTIQNQPELSTLFTYVNASRSLRPLFDTKDNFTFLAPSNAAFDDWKKSPAALQPGDDRMEGLLQYHLLQRAIPTVSFTNVVRFQTTYLNNATFSNVTDGQVVGIGSNKAGPFVVSGNKTQTTFLRKDIIVKSGVVHITNDVLTLPIAMADSITQANLDYFIGVLTQGGYNNPTPSVMNVLFGNDRTVFAPNTRPANTDFTAVTQNRSKAQVDDMFNYHVVPSFNGYFSSLKDGMNLTTASGKDLHVRVVGSTTFINGARITASNYLTANGVLHTIDTLLDPQNITSPTADQIKAANGTRSDSDSSSNDNNNRDHNRNKTALGVAAIVGISIGGTILLCAIAALVCLHVRRRRDSKRNQIYGGSGRGGGPGSPRPLIGRLRTNVQELDTETRGSTANSSPSSAHSTTAIHDTYYHGTNDKAMPYYGNTYSELDIAVEDKRREAGDSYWPSPATPTPAKVVREVRPQSVRVPIELDAGPVPTKTSTTAKHRPLIVKTMEVSVTEEKRWETFT